MRHGAAVAGAIAVALALAGCQGGNTSSGEPSADPDPPIAADVLQLRRDQVLERFEVAVRNLGTEDIRVTRLGLDIPGYDGPGSVEKDSRIPAGQVVNLPIPYGSVECPDEGDPDAGPPRVTLHVQSGEDPELRTVHLTAGSVDGIIDQVATRACAVQRIQREVDLRFADDWRLTRSPQGKELHGHLLARLVEGEARDLTQVAGAILYGLRPDESAGQPPDPLGSVRPGARAARIPVIAYAARCDGHTIGEIKKPYEFLVWVSGPGGEELAVTPTVDQPTKLALRKVCAF